MTCTCGDCKCYECEYANASIDECIIAFNRDVRNPGWANARGRFHQALRKKFLYSKFDCSSFIKYEELIPGRKCLTMSLKHKIRIEGLKILQIKD